MKRSSRKCSTARSCPTCRTPGAVLAAAGRSGLRIAAKWVNRHAMIADIHGSSCGAEAASDEALAGCVASMGLMSKEDFIAGKGTPIVEFLKHAAAAALIKSVKQLIAGDL